jgi:hypothetical protein
MRIGGYQMEDLGYGIKVVEHEAGWSFWLQGDDAQQFRDEWQAYQRTGGQRLPPLPVNALL